MTLGSFTAISTDPNTKIPVPPPPTTATPAEASWQRACRTIQRLRAPNPLPPNPHSIRGTLNDRRPRVPSLTTFERRPTVQVAA